MPINLDAFREISNGTYNAGHVDLKTDSNGTAIGLKKVNRHVTITSLNGVTVKRDNAVKVKEAFISALREGGGLKEEVLADIRQRLGIANMTSDVAGASEMLNRRFRPLTRQEVREILHEYNLDGRNGAAPQEAPKYRNGRENTNRMNEHLVDKNPMYEMLFELLSGKSCSKAADTAMKNNPNMAKLAIMYNANRNDSDARDMLKQRKGEYFEQAARTLVALRAAVASFVGNPNALPRQVQTPYGPIELSYDPGGEIANPRLEVKFNVDNETFTVGLDISSQNFATRLDGQIEEAAQALGKGKLGQMLTLAEANGGVEDGSIPCAGRTVARAILSGFAHIGKEFLDTLDNASLVRYAKDTVAGTAEWTEETIKKERNDMLLDKAVVMAILMGSGYVEDGNEAQEAAEEIVRNAQENKDANENAIELDSHGIPIPPPPPPPPPTVNFRFGTANLSQEERQNAGDFAAGLVRAAGSGDAAALKALVKANPGLLIRMAADPDGAARFFPEKAVPDAKGLGLLLAEAFGDAVKAGTDRTVDFQSFTQDDEAAIKAMFDAPEGKGADAAEGFAAKLKDALLAKTSVTARKPSADALTAVANTLGGTSAGTLAALAKNDLLALLAFASGKGRIAGRNAAQSAEIKAAILLEFRNVTGKAALDEMSLADFDALARKCAEEGLFDKALGAIAARNTLFGGELFGAVGGSGEKRVGAAAAQKDIGAVPKAPQTAETANVKGADNKVDLHGDVGGVTLHVDELLDTDAPRPHLATSADLRGLAADLMEAAEGVLAGGASASPEKIRAAILKDINAFCRFIDNPKALSDAVMPQLRGLVEGAMKLVRAAIADAVRELYNADNPKNPIVLDPQDKKDLANLLRRFRPGEIKAFVARMEAAKFMKVAAAFSETVDDSAVQMQKFVNGVCKLDPNAKIVSEYDGMTADQIKASLEKKSLDEIIDDSLRNPARPGLLAFQMKALSTYFTSVSHARKREVLASALRNAPDAADAKSVAAETKFLSAIFLGAGPLMQKTLQSIDPRVAGEHGGAFGVLKSSMPPIDPEYVNRVVKKIAADNPQFESVAEYDRNFYRSLGAATIAEVVQCNFLPSDNSGNIVTAIVKIQRPGVKERFDEDVKIFAAIAKDVPPSVRKIWNGRVKSIADEFDFTIEAGNIRTGQVYEVKNDPYETVEDKKTGKKVRKIDAKTQKPVFKKGCEETSAVSAMKLLEGVKPTREVLVGQTAAGEPFDKILDRQTERIHGLFAGVFETDATGRIRRGDDGKPVVRKDMSLAGLVDIKRRIEQSVRDIHDSAGYFKQAVWKWVAEALFGSGVMHNDVHTGNLMLDIDSDRITFIDFGNVVTLDAEERKQLLVMIAAVASKHSDFFIGAFGKLLGEGTQERAAFDKIKDKLVKTVVQQVIHKGHSSRDTGYRFHALVLEMEKLGVAVPPKVFAFAEGLARLQKCHEELAGLVKETEGLYRAYEDQILSGNTVLPPREKDDEIGRLLDFMLKPDSYRLVAESYINSDDDTPEVKELKKEAFQAREWLCGTIYYMDNSGVPGGVLKGTLVDQIEKDIEEEETKRKARLSGEAKAFGRPDGAKLAHHVSMVTRHLAKSDAAKIDRALALFVDVWRRLHDAEVTGDGQRAGELRAKMAEAKVKLMRALHDGVHKLEEAFGDCISEETKLPEDWYFETESAAEVFADIVMTHQSVVTDAFSGGNYIKILNAFRKVGKENKYHKNDGHNRAVNNKL